MRHLFLLTLLLGAGVLAAPSSAPTFTPTCAVKAVASTQWWLPGQLVTVTPLPCASGGRAYVRFRSRTGSQPDAPPGFFTLREGQRVTRRVPDGWWVEARDKSLLWYRVPFTPRGGNP